MGRDLILESVGNSGVKSQYCREEILGPVILPYRVGFIRICVINVPNKYSGLLM